jgi:GTP cyclohydrolase I
MPDTPEAKRLRLETLCRGLLAEIDADPERSGLQDTPARWARMWLEFIDCPATPDTCFESVRTDQMVVVSGMRVWSMCEHHLLPFWCDVTVGYIARAHILGLSKFARIAHRHARRLQVQERLVDGIAEDVVNATRSDDVAVIARGEHLCMTMRGVRTPALMTSSAMRGVFRTDATARAEFLTLSTPTR